MTKRLQLITLALWALILCPLSAGAAIEPNGKNIYVNAAVTTSGDGSEWSKATASLTEALQYANDHYVEGLTILVAEGTYYPEVDENITTDGTTPTTNLRDRTFLITSDVTIRGGYKADGSDDWDPVAYPTILSGDLSKSPTSSGPAYHVVLAVGISEADCIAPTLEGLTITGGNSLNASMDVKINNLVINQTDGAGLYNQYANTYVHQVVITANQTSFGGGIFNLYSSPTLTSVVITGNQANDGGGIANLGGSSPTLTQVTIAGNKAVYSGGGIFNGGSFPELQNSVVWGNTATTGANVNGSTPTYTNCLVGGIKIVDNDKNTNNLDGTLIKDPDFVQWIDPSADGWTPTAGGNYSLKCSSLLIGVGDNDTYKTATNVEPADALDVAGNPRLNGDIIDIGAYERVTPVPDENNMLYVNPAARPGGNGSSWLKALPSLADALLFTNANAETEYTILVAQGTYYPESTEGIEDGNEMSGGATVGPRDCTFLITSNVTIRGGYKADGSGEWDPVAYPTILSGDLDKNGELTFGDAYHVVLAVGTSKAAIAPTLEGVTITGGNSDGGSRFVKANGIESRQANGAGIHNNYFANTRLQQVVITGNKASGQGGGIYSSNSDLTLTSVVITGNKATNYGGGIYNNISKPTLTSVVISGNQAGKRGGGICNDNNSYSKLTSVVISGNQAGDEDGGGIYNGYRGFLTLTQVTVAGNQAGRYGGGIYNGDYGSLTLTQVTIAGNQAGRYGGGIYNTCSPTLQNSVVWGNTATTGANVFNKENDDNTPTYSYCLVGGEALEGVGNLDGETTDPGFVKWIDPAADSEWEPTSAGDYRLTATSPLIDKGDNDAYLEAMDIEDFTGALDIAGNPRLKGSAIDIGAYEYQSADAPATVYHTLTLEIAPGILLHGISAGEHLVSDHLFLQFLPEDATLTADDVMLLIDGVDTPFNVPAAGMYYSYILPITGEHTVLIAQREYTVTLPETEGITYNVGAGTHAVAYGERFAFTITGDFAPDQLHVYANGQEISPSNSPEGEALRSEAREGTSSLSYIIDAVTGPITVTLEGTTTANASLTHGVRLVIDNGQLTIDNEMGTAVDVTVYTLTGKTFVQLRELRGSKTITLPAGIYIVRAGEQRWKVMIND